MIFTKKKSTDQAVYGIRGGIDAIKARGKNFNEGKPRIDREEKMAKRAHQAAVKEEKRLDRERRKARQKGTRYLHWFDRVEDLQKGTVESQTRFYERMKREPSRAVIARH